MTCPYAHDDAAYVLGALTPAERLELERHLAECDACAGSVRALAGLPGLLDLVDPNVLEESSPDAVLDGSPLHDQALHDPPLPETLLPALTREVDRGRRRRAYLVSGLAAGLAAVVVTVAALSVSVVAQRSDDRPPVAAPSATTAAPSGAAQTVAMAPVGEVPLQATVGLEEVRWGTRLLVTCTYDPRSVEYGAPPEADYVLFVRDRDGGIQRVGSWRSTGGTTMQVPAATAVDRADIAGVEVRTTDGRVVLRARV
jgi:anti-sigma factor RsiW